MPVSDATDLSPPPVGPGQGALTDVWHFAAMARDLRPGKLQRFEILGEPILIGRGRQGAVYAVRDICPHRSAPLSAGKLTTEANGRESVECPYHGWRFGLDGACTAIPSLVADQAMDVSRIRVRRYPVRESQGLVFIWFSSDPRFDGEPETAPPVLPGVAMGKPKRVGQMILDTPFARAALDLKDTPRVPDSRPYAILGRRPQMEVAFGAPGLRWAHVTVGKRHVLSLTCLTPITAHQTRQTEVLWSDHPAFWLLKA